MLCVLDGHTRECLTIEAVTAPGLSGPAAAPNAGGLVEDSRCAIARSTPRLTSNLALAASKHDSGIVAEQAGSTANTSMAVPAYPIIRDALACVIESPDWLSFIAAKNDNVYLSVILDGDALASRNDG
jgi:hypothetical protein